MQRRLFCLGMGGSLATAMPGAVAREADAEEALRRIEAASGGRLGVYALDIGTGRRLAWRADERFPMCSTFKFLAAAFVLHRADRNLEALGRPVAIPAKEDLVPYSPSTELHAGRTMTVAQLCGAAVTLSDNTAANLMLESFGGPAGLTGFARSLGDRMTRLDRNEPLLNEATPGDERDTTTPAAMVGLMNRLLLEGVLTPGSRAQLQNWLLGNTTGGKQIRAGLPPGWRVGDKTGSGGHGTSNDIAIVWPPDSRSSPDSRSAPLLVAAYLTETSLAMSERYATLATVAALLPGMAGNRR